MRLVGPLVEGEGVSENETTFSVRVEDLDSKPLERGDNIRDAEGVAVGHILYEADGEGEIDLESELDSPVEDSKADAGSSLVRVHVLSQGSLDGETAGVVADSLSDNRENIGRVLLVAPVEQLDDVGFIPGALSNCVEEVETILFDLLSTEVVDFDAVAVFFLDFDGFLVHVLRGGNVRSGIHKDSDVLVSLGKDDLLPESLLEGLAIAEKQVQFLDEYQGTVFSGESRLEIESEL